MTNGREWIYSYLSKVNLVENDLVGMANSPEAGDECQDGYDGEGSLVIALGTNGLALCSLLYILEVHRLGALFVVLLACAGDIALAQRPLRRRGRRGHDGEEWRFDALSEGGCLEMSRPGLGS